MQAIFNGMLQTQAAAARATANLTLWQENFAKVCEARGLKVIINDDMVTIENVTGQEVDIKALCAQASDMSYPKEDPLLTKPDPMPREEWDRTVDEMEDRKEEDAAKAKRRADLMGVLVAARERSIARSDFLSVLTFETIRISIEKDLI